MPFDFPSSPTAGQIFTPPGGPTYVWQSPRWLVRSAATAETRSRIVNGAMQISQETNGVASSVTNSVPADQFHMYWAGTGMNCTADRLTSGDGSGKVIRLFANAAKASLAAADISILYQYIEGSRVADFGWGTASAKPAVLRFDLQCGVAGTYGLAICNIPGTYTFTKPLLLETANAWKTFTIPIPVPPTSTWAVDNGVGIAINWTFASGSSTLTAVEGWSAGAFRGMTGMTNGMTTANTSFYLRNVGLYLDPQATGLPPAWVMPDEAEELRACQRYWEKVLATSVSQANVYGTHYFKATKRVTPAMSATIAPSGNFGPGVAAFNILHNATTGFDWYANSRM